MNIVEILVTAKNLSGPAFADAKAGATAMEATMAKLNKMANLAAGAMVLFLGESVKMASKFDSEMTLLNTQAGVAKSEMGKLSKGVLDLAGKVAQDPDSLAEALFHVESNFESMGITSEKALKLTETAAKGATVGHANLVDVTNALTAAVASGIPGVEDFDQAMGVLNATVGVGDMKMQDLASAFGSGMVATVKGFGLNIKDVGAALAVFGDNNIRGSLAGNQLRMSVMALANPVKGSGDALARLGLETDTLAKDMQKGGLKLALEDLSDRMKKAGISADQQGQIITEAFGRKAGAGLNVLLSQMDRVESKYPALEEGAGNFGAAWAETTETFAFKWKAMEEKINSFMIQVGEKLIPGIMEVVDWMSKHQDAVIKTAEALGALIAALTVYSLVLNTTKAVMTVFTAAQWLLNIAMDANPIGIVVGALGLLATAFYLAWTRSETFRVGVVLAFSDVSDIVLAVYAQLLGATHEFVDGIAAMAEKVVHVLAMIPGPTQKSMKEAEVFIKAFRDAAEADFNASVGKVDEWRQAVQSMPTEVVLKANIDELNAKINDAKVSLASVPPDKQTAIRANIDELQRQANAAQARIDALHGKVLPITASFQSRFLDAGQQNAHGGIIGGAASGGSRGGMTWVGEQGPELVRLPFGSSVIPAGQSRSMAAAGAGGGQVLRVEWVGGNAGDEFMSWLRKNIRIQGGDVQAVLGQ